LHSDTKISGEEIKIIQSALKDKVWGRFNIKLSGTNVLFRVIETMINIRSCITGIATGDQGIFVKRDIFESLNGYADIPLMEDIDLSKKLKTITRPLCLNDVIVTSSRRWENKGIIATVLLMWRLRFLYWLGVSPVTLAEHYR
ncbi:MAG: glycosyl transferase, partial [Gammaproteobacteria bacterium]|nr:glycosyl transferase [Gammaproteobacteria bacterium]